ncbi:UNVERIFIED_CONTAM: hypothetical protein FKN15_042263 [Acipenser sinensis]
MGSMEYGPDAWYLSSTGDTALHEEQKDHITGNGTSEKEPVEKNYIEDGKNIGNKNGKKGEGLMGSSFFTWFMIITLLGVWTSVAVVWFDLVDYEDVLDGKNIGNKNGKKGEGLMGSSFFTWFMIITLLGVWTSVAVVWFDLVDYEDVLGIPARAKDFRYNLSEVLQDGKNIGNKNGKKGEGLMGSSFFTWFMIITLLGVWTSVAVVWFDLVDYEDVLGIPARAKDFRYNISEVLQGLSKDGSNVNLDSLEEVLNILAEEGSDWFYGFLTFLYDVMTPFEILEDEESETADDVAEESVVQEEVQQELTPEEKLLEEEQIPLQEAEEEKVPFEELEEEEEEEEEKTGHLVEAAEVLPPVEEEQEEEEEVEMLVAPLEKVEFPTEERVEEAAPTEEVGVEEAAPTEEERVEEEKVEEFPLEEESVEDEAAPSEEEKAEEMVEAAPLEQEMEEDAPLEQEMEEAISLEEAIIEEEGQVEDVSASMEEQYEEMEAQVGEADAEEERNEEKEESPGEEIAVETVFAEDPVEDATGEEVASEPEEEAPEQEEYTDSDPFPEDEEPQEDATGVPEPEPDMHSEVHAEESFYKDCVLLNLNLYQLAYKWYEIGHQRGHFASVWQQSLYNVDRLKAQAWWTAKETGYTDLVKVKRLRIPAEESRRLVLCWRDFLRLPAAREDRSWEEIKVLIFNDSFEHEVWQDADGYRLIFIVDVWHPELTPHQRLSLQSKM